MVRRRSQENAFSLFSFQDIITSVTGIVILIALIFCLQLIRSAAKEETVSQEEAVTAPAVARDALEKKLAEYQLVYSENASLLERIAPLPISELMPLLRQLKSRVTAQETIAEEAEIKKAQVEAEAEKKASELAALRHQIEKSLAQEVRKLEQDISTSQKVQKIIYNPNPNSAKSAWLVDLHAKHIHALPAAGGALRTFDVERPGSSPRRFLQWAKARDASSEYFVLLIRAESLSLYEDVRSDLESFGFDLGFDLVGDESQVQVLSPVTE